MRALIAATTVAAMLAGVAPASAGPWHRWYGPYPGPRAYAWGWGGPHRWGGPRVYGGFRGGYGYGGYGYGGFGGGGHQTATGGPSGGRIGGS